MVGWILLLTVSGCTADPCESGFLYLPSGDAFLSMEEAAKAAGVEGLVHVCPGTHDLSEDIRATRPNTSGLLVLGDRDGRSTLRLTGTQPAVDGARDSPVEIRDLTFADSNAVGRTTPLTRNGMADGTEYEYVDPFEGEAALEGGPEASRHVRFVDVTFRDNQGMWGGGVEVVADTYDELTFDSCTFERNQATYGSRGGAMAVVADLYALSVHGWEFDGTIVSINTDWGSGDDDNLGGDELIPDDISFLHTDSDVSNNRVYLDATYNFDGVASFTCDVATAVCE